LPILRRIVEPDVMPDPVAGSGIVAFFPYALKKSGDEFWG
jgi:hypothetical protein